jgi:diaminopimelate epimerase
MKTETRTLHVIKCSPSGNITALVFTPVERKFHARISQEIMRSQPDVEQVGFIESAGDPAALGRLQMMGGEFCGNAASAYFSILSRQRHILKALIEVSGKTAPLKAALVGDRVELKLSERIDIRKSTVPGSTAVVDMEGITHLLCEMPVPEDEKTSAADLLSANKLLDLPAAGVIFFSQTGQEVHITPVVWVKETRSLVCESACASGTMALAVWMKRHNTYPGQAIHVTQPGGAVISVNSEQGANGQVEITMQSRVTLLDETDIKIDLEP